MLPDVCCAVPTHRALRGLYETRSSSQGRLLDFCPEHDISSELEIIPAGKIK